MAGEDKKRILNHTQIADEDEKLTHKIYASGQMREMWFNRTTEYGFVENIDFIVIVKNVDDDTLPSSITAYTEVSPKLEILKKAYPLCIRLTKM